MKPLFDITKIDDLDLLPFECYSCSGIFNKKKNEVKKALNGHKKIKIKFCSNKCKYQSRITKKEFECGKCGNKFLKRLSEINKNNFCSKSCSATYNNKHKKSGGNRSNFEKYIEKELRLKYTELSLKFNDRKVIGQELDLFIPELKLAFEFNGIFHYKPIFGDKKLKRTKEIDEIKISLCKRNGIELYVINISRMEKFSIANSKKYFKKILKIIKQYCFVV